jgi:hypothetical protein
MKLRARFVVLSVVFALLMVPQATAAAPALTPNETPAIPTHHTSVGGVTVNALPGHGVVEIGHATNSPSVTVGLPIPVDATSHVRLSNDGAMWVVRPFAASIPWDLTDPAGGGDPADGFKTVQVEYGDGTTWHPVGSDYLYLDREAPIWPDFALENGADSVASWKPEATGTYSDFSGVAARRMSLDGVRWTPWNAYTLDIRSIDYGGSWALGPRTLYYQIQDGAGNVSEIFSDSIEITYPPLDFDSGTVPVRFEFPRPAVTGSLFTIRPIYPPGFTMPSNAWCSWNLGWSDGASLDGGPSEHWASLDIDRKASAGGCGEWTFTLPYNFAPQFDVMFALVTKTASQEPYLGMGTLLFASQNAKVMNFTASIGTTDPHIRQSTMPLVYLLPDSTVTQKGDPVTYRLYASGGLTIPQTGMFWTSPMNCYINPQWSQQGGTSFTYTPSCDGYWVTGWSGTYKGGYMRTQYDPVVDGKPPVVGAPVVRLDRAAVGTQAPITVSYTGRDSASGLYQFQLQRSVNGGTWTSVALPSRLAQVIKTTLSLTAKTRFRVRARDKVGNWSAWRYGPTIKGSAYQEWSPYVRWSGTWANNVSTRWMGGAARTSTRTGSASAFVVTGRSVGWVGRKGPDRGLVRVLVDGKVVGTIDLRSPTVGPRSVLWAATWLVAGTHVIRLENLGTAGSPGVDVDAFLTIR